MYCMTRTYTSLYNKSQHVFMHMLLLQLDCSNCCSNVCCLTYVVVYELFCMKLYESCYVCAVGLTITLDCQLTYFIAFDASSLVCSLPIRVLLQVSKGHTHLNPPVLEPLMHLPRLTAVVTPLLLTELSYLPLCNIAVKAYYTTHCQDSYTKWSEVLLGLLIEEIPLHVGVSSTVNTLS